MVDKEKQRYRGEIKIFFEAKGYGFITSEAFPDKDIFFMRHSAQIQAQGNLWKKGSWCTFKINETDRNLEATDLFLVGAAGQFVKKTGGGLDWDRGRGRGGGEDDTLAFLAL